MPGKRGPQGAYKVKKGAPSKALPPRPTTRRLCLGPICLGRWWFDSTGSDNRRCEKCDRRVAELLRANSPLMFRGNMESPQ